jgi:hypothetical protein
MKFIDGASWLGAAVALVTLTACNPSTPPAAPRTNAPRDWSASHGKETGAPTTDTPKQQPSNQGGQATPR